MSTTGSVAVVGIGMMGPGIAAISAIAGNKTVLVHPDAGRLGQAVERARSLVDQLREGELVTGDRAAQARGNLYGVEKPADAVEGAFLVVEAISEDLQAKRELFRRLGELTSPETILASNTSGLRISDIAARTAHPERTATAHFWFPAHLVPLVEIVMGERTTAATAESLRSILTTWGKSPVVVKRDLPGQLANRILQAIIREAVNIVEKGLASAEDVDTAIKAGMAIRFPVWGPLEHIDAVGLDLALSVQRDVLPGLNNSSEPGKYLASLCERGELGAKAGKGFYDWGVKSMPKLAACRDAFIMSTVRLLKQMSKEGICP